VQERPKRSDRNQSAQARRTRTLIFVTSLLALVTGCAQSKPLPTIEVEAIHPKLVTVAPEPRESQQERARCEQRIREVLAEPEVPGAPKFDAHRLQILSRAKAEPLLLVDTPQFVDATDPGYGVKAFRKLILGTEYPYDVIKSRLDRYVHRPQEGRATLLRDGYLYSDDPELAYALVNLVGAEHLFNEKTIWLQRGEFVHHAVRKRGRYYFSDGPNEGDEVRLLLLDRVGTGPDPKPEDTLVRDFRSLKYRLHFTEASPSHITKDHIVTTLRYGKYRVPSLLEAKGARLSLACEIVDYSLRAKVDEQKRITARRQRAIQPLRRTMQKEIEEQIPFDEPLREFGNQLDGELRRSWLHAYTLGNNTYAFNGDRYRVFDAKGRPIPPQVCVDFLIDTLERSGGTWWHQKGEPRERLVGKLDFGDDLVERSKLRRVPGFLEYAHAHPEKFDVLDIDPSERVELGNRDAFLAQIERRWRDFMPGDILVIKGKTPWDPSEEHYHSFFIYESDPLTGTPLALVGNAGRPSVRFWEVEARRTPERSIRYRIRPKTEWLESFVDVDESETDRPPPISPRGNAGT
jgi:hypothetical protein